MRDISKSEAEWARPSIPARQAINFCIRKLLADDEKSRTDEVVEGLTYEELLGALMLAKDLAED